MRHLDLFSGIGGFSIAAESAGFETIAFCEIDPEASLVLAHHWPNVPNLHDIRTLTIDRHPHLFPDLITGGVPCQPASALGLMRGTSDERWLWPESIRVMREFRPSYGVFENPPALLTLESGDAWNGIVSGLVALGYDCWWDVFPAAAFGAGHLRERVILVCAHAAGIAQRIAANQGDAQPSGRHAWFQPSGDGDFQMHASFADGSGRRAGRTGRLTGDSEGASEQALQLASTNADRERLDRQRILLRPESPAGRGAQEVLEASGSGQECLASDPISARLQGHPRYGEERDESRRDESGKGRIGKGTNRERDESGKGRPATPPDLRGRVTGAEWWHEAHTGIPVLATGIPARVVEAVSRCVGNSVVPQAIVPVMEAIASTFQLSASGILH